MSRPACMGGMCPRREACLHYHITGWTRSHPAERLCAPKQADHYAPVQRLIPIKEEA